jgi:hypothetical protein
MRRMIQKFLLGTGESYDSYSGCIVDTSLDTFNCLAIKLSLLLAWLLLNSKTPVFVIDISLDDIDDFDLREDVVSVDIRSVKLLLFELFTSKLVGWFWLCTMLFSTVSR